ncbi:hypothetical protein ACA910_017959 [Epithemia clementina (nom. ined.)]
MVITYLVDAGATTGIVASTHRSPELIRLRQLLSQESKATSQTISTTTEEELHRALVEALGINGFHITGASAADFDWPPQQNSGSFSFSYQSTSFSYPSVNTKFSFSFPPFESDLSFSFPPIKSYLSFSMPRGEWSFSIPPAQEGHYSFSFPNIDDSAMGYSMSYPPSRGDMSLSYTYLDPSDVNRPINGSQGSTNTEGDSVGTNHDNEDSFSQIGVSSSEDAGSEINSDGDESNNHSNSPIDESLSNKEQEVEQENPRKSNEGARSTQVKNDLDKNGPSSIDSGDKIRGKNSDGIAVGVFIAVLSGMVLIVALVYMALSRKLRGTRYSSAAAASLMGSDGSDGSSVSVETEHSRAVAV